MTKNTAERTRSFQVTIAGEDDWTNVVASDDASAGEAYVETIWDGDQSRYELDVRGPDNKLTAVTVDVSFSVSFDGYSEKHPGDDS